MRFEKAVDLFAFVRTSLTKDLSLTVVRLRGYYGKALFTY